MRFVIPGTITTWVTPSSISSEFLLPTSIRVVSERQVTVTEEHKQMCIRS